MQFQLISVVLILLNCIGSQNASRGRRHRRMNTGVSQNCPKGCDQCSDFNGCLSCKPRLFFSLERNGMKQTGVCLSSCPSGYYGVRTPERNTCAQCTAENCDTCFNKNFCTKCKPAFYLHKGKCFDICPEGFAPNNQTMECTTTVHCEVSEWSAWGPCTKRGKTCGFRKGTETRSRDILQKPSAHGNLCPKTSERRKCTVQKKRCPPGQKGNKGKELKKPEKEMTQDKQDKGSRRDKENKRNKEGRVRKERPENKRRRGPNKKQVYTTASTVP